MRRYGSKSKSGILIRCPKCGYHWRTKQHSLVCCSKCKRYFKL